LCKASSWWRCFSLFSEILIPCAQKCNFVFISAFLFVYGFIPLSRRSVLSLICLVSVN
jgi:hypothetical protein